MTRLQDLYSIGGQSPWLDNLRRDWIEGGQLAEFIDLGVRGITSNPTILAKAISGQNTYDEQFRELMKDHTVEGAYWEMAISDIHDALKMLRPLSTGCETPASTWRTWSRRSRTRACTPSPSLSTSSCSR